MERTPYPISSRRGCQCADGTYSSKCCDGNSQGIGGLTDGSNSIIKTLDGDGNVIDTTGNGNFVCTSTTLTGFAIADDGTITAPTASLGTITATSPASFATVTESTLRTLRVTITAPSGFNNSGESIICSVTAYQAAPPPLADLVCDNITLTGFAVAWDGTITLPTTNIGTIASTTPASFDDVDTDTLRTLNVNITVPSGYGNTGSTITCTTTATQPADQPALACGDITFTGYAVDFKGAITTPSVDIGTVSSISPTSFNGHVNTDTSRTITVNVTVPSGYSNSGQTLSCTQTVTQTAVKSFWVRYEKDEFGYAAGAANSHSQSCTRQTNDTLINFEFIHLGSTDVPTMSDEVYIVRGRAGSPTNACGFGGTGFGSYFIVHGHATLIGSPSTVGERLICQNANIGHASGYLVEPAAANRTADFTITTDSTGVTGYTSCS